MLLVICMSPTVLHCYKVCELFPSSWCWERAPSNIWRTRGDWMSCMAPLHDRLVRVTDHYQPWDYLEGSWTSQWTGQYEVLSRECILTCTCCCSSWSTDCDAGEEERWWILANVSSSLVVLRLLITCNTTEVLSVELVCAQSRQCIIKLTSHQTSIH